MKIRVQKNEVGCEYWLVAVNVPERADTSTFTKGVVIDDNGKIGWEYLSSLTVIDPKYTGGKGNG